MAKPAGRPGRPKKPDGEKLEQFSIRLPPKLKLGLELLARHQGRSLSAAIEWALQAALNQVKVGADSTSLLLVASLAWEASGYERVLSIYDADPTLISFEERHACKLVQSSAEALYLDKLLRSAADDEDFENALLLVKKWRAIINCNWASLLDDANTLTISSVMDTGVSLLQIIGMGEKAEALGAYDEAIQIEAEFDELLALGLVTSFPEEEPTAPPP
jgi:hypothetical protein